jgi:hypothetical protein
VLLRADALISDALIAAGRTVLISIVQSSQNTSIASPSFSLSSASTFLGQLALRIMAAWRSRSSSSPLTRLSPGQIERIAGLLLHVSPYTGERSKLACLTRRNLRFSKGFAFRGQYRQRACSPALGDRVHCHDRPSTDGAAFSLIFRHAPKLYGA